ncbi:MAG: hypothetical protein HQL69_02645 [Magnetococcales bacterium]|nr:hypothetical protein [Magnetococcales bacterium]
MSSDHHRIARAHPNLSASQSLVAQLGETFEMERHLQISEQDIHATEENTSQRKELLEVTGTIQEVQAAQKMAKATVRDIILKVSAHDLQEGLEAMRLSESDFRKAIQIKKLMQQKLDRTNQQKQSFELER